MKTWQYVNAFDYNDIPLAFVKIQRTLSRAYWEYWFWNLVLVGLTLGAWITTGHQGWLWLFGFSVAVMSMLTRYFDALIRIGVMHIIDYMEHQRCNQGSSAD